MTDFPYIGGGEVAEIFNKDFMRFETVKAKEICLALDKSGISFSARYSEAEIILTYDGSYKEEVEAIITKAESGDYEALLRELQTYGVPDGYYRLLGEVADLLHTTIGTLQTRPDDVQIALCKTYVDFWLCDSTTIQRELDRIITVNGRTLSDIQEHEQGKEQEKTSKMPEAPTVPSFTELADSYLYRHAQFTRKNHRHLTEIAQRWQRSEQGRIIQAEERERKK